MYLSRLILNPRSREVRRDLGDAQALHKTVMRALPPADGRPHSARAVHGVLFRAEVDGRAGRVVLLVQSRIPPDWSVLVSGYLLEGVGENPATKDIAQAWAAIRDGLTLRFRLRVNPTRKIETKSGPDGVRRNGRRVPLGDDASRLTWLERKSVEAGFRLAAAAPGVPDVRVVKEAKLAGWRQSTMSRLTFAPVLFDGRLIVTNADRFREGLEQGIGPGKAYGFGLLSIGGGPSAS